MSSAGGRARAGDEGACGAGYMLLIAKGSLESGENIARM